MTVAIEIREDACRGCRMCADACPVSALGFDEGKGVATVREARDCFACLTCALLCPSGALRHSGHHAVKNFYRDLDFSARVGRFL
jgi:ferredoxin